ncbi:FKBP-type peptidyl-prolyl cis-trans isomerase [Chitinophaga niabensis]|uniref:FKBP-type peptidyl-prolyl cis-trans isomerase n=1 Tax=Chitinophaga niabensis TaxID=536979 RepID=UPI0031BAB189
MINKQSFHLHLLLACCLAVLLGSCAKSQDLSADAVFMDLQKETEFIQFRLKVKNQDSGVLYHPSGMGYKIIAPGNGRDTIKAGSIPSIVYTRSLFGYDKVIESSQNLPTSFDNRPLKDHIIGWQIGLTLITKGGRIILYIPSSLAFGRVGVPPNIPPNAILECDITLVDFK